MSMQKNKFLSKHGLKVNIYDEKKLKKLGMNALLGVGQAVSEDRILSLWSGMEQKKIQNL